MTTTTPDYNLTPEEYRRIMAGGNIMGVGVTCEFCEQPAVWSTAGDHWARVACRDLDHIAMSQSNGSAIHLDHMLAALECGLERLVDVAIGTTTTTIPREHFHVLAVQDWGGTQEFVRGNDTPMTRADAEQLARDMLRADLVVTGRRVPPTVSQSDDFWTRGVPSMVSQSDQEWFDSLDDDRVAGLISTNVAPGWEGIWIVSCDGTCRFAETFNQRPEQWGDPWLTPPPF